MPHFMRFAYSEAMSTTSATVSRATTRFFELLGATFGAPARGLSRRCYFASSAEKVRRTCQPSFDVLLPSRSPMVVAPSEVVMASDAADAGMVADASPCEIDEHCVPAKLAAPVRSAMGI